MAENTKIEWATHTFNPWVGCTRLSPACDHCYAESWARRTGQAGLWQGERRRTSEANWRQPRKWDRLARKGGERPRVFCASLADAFDNQIPPEWRTDLWHLIEATPYLDWMLLTKRPENIGKMLWPKWDGGLPANIWLGTTVEDYARTRRIGHLQKVSAAVRFLSCEPLLEDLGRLDLTGIHLVIAGGESGPRARPSNPKWFRSLRDQCEHEGVAFHFKQWGEWTSLSEVSGAGAHFSFVDGATVRRIGKAAAGRMLDGRLHDAMPSLGGEG